MYYGANTIPQSELSSTVELTAYCTKLFLKKKIVCIIVLKYLNIFSNFSSLWWFPSHLIWITTKVLGYVMVKN